MRRASQVAAIVLGASSCQLLGLRPAPCTEDAHCKPAQRCDVGAGTCAAAADDAGIVDEDGGLPIELDAGTDGPVADDADYVVAAGAPFTFTVTVRSESAADVVVTTQPQHGVVDATASTTDGPTFVYTPDAQYVGADEIVVRATVGGVGDDATIAFDVKDWWDASFKTRVKVDLDPSAVPDGGTVTDAPILLQLPVEAAALGGDVRVVDEDGETQLSMDPRPTGAGLTWPIWVKLPALTAAVPRHVWVYLRDGATTGASSAADVWSADYRGVWHLDDDLADATARGNVATDVGAVAAPGKVGGGRACDGTGGHLDVGTRTDFLIRGDLTVSAWVNVASLDAVDFGNSVVVQGLGGGTLDTTRNYLFFLWLDENERPALFYQHGLNDDDVRATASIAPSVVGRWAWLAATRTSDGVVTFYADGEQVGAPVVHGQAAAEGSAGKLWFCADPEDPAMWNLQGSIDEVNVAATTRSAGFLRVQHASVAGTLTTFRGVEQLD